MRIVHIFVTAADEGETVLSLPFFFRLLKFCSVMFTKIWGFVAIKRFQCGSPTHQQSRIPAFHGNSRMFSQSHPDNLNPSFVVTLKKLPALVIRYNLPQVNIYQNRLRFFLGWEQGKGLFYYKSLTPSARERTQSVHSIYWVQFTCVLVSWFGPGRQL